MREVSVTRDQSIGIFLVRGGLADDVLEAQVLLYAGCVKINHQYVNAYGLVRDGDLVSRARLREPANTIWAEGNHDTVLAVAAAHMDISWMTGTTTVASRP